MDRLKVLHTGGSDGQLYLRESLNKWFKLLGRMVKEFLLFSICVCQSNTSLTLFDIELEMPQKIVVQLSLAT